MSLLRIAEEDAQVRQSTRGIREHDLLHRCKALLTWDYRIKKGSGLFFFETAATKRHGRRFGRMTLPKAYENETEKR